jgi:hypothetical protein
MCTAPESCGHCLLNHLTAARLALEAMRRRAPLSDGQDRLVGMAMAAVDKAAAEAREPHQRASGRR